jgi:DNA repair ATPase RecN
MTGPSVKPARIEFRSGLNVVSGASNTGKSFIFHAVDFAFGAAGPMLRIPESDPYTELEVTLETPEGAEYSLRRSCQGGGFTLRDLSAPEN